MTDNVQHATHFEAGAGLFIFEVNRYVDGHDGLRRDAQEVDMQQLVLDRIELIVFGEHLVLLAADFDLANSGQEAP